MALTAMRAVSPALLGAIARDQQIRLMGYDLSGVYRDRLPGGRATGMRPSDFDARALRRGTAVELEHTGRRDIAREIAMDHLAEHPGYYPALARMERRLTRAHAGFGAATDAPFDLNDPANVLELKQALYALGRQGSDPLQNADPIQERRWEKIALTGDDAGAWDGPAADELVAAIGRHAAASGISGPYMQIGGSKFGIGIVGGPQPTARGLEVIAGAVEQRLGGQPAMSRYLAWRDGAFAPPSTISMPGAGAIVTPTTRHAAMWNPEGYTPVWPEGDPQWVAAAAQIDQALVSCWQQLEAMAHASEADRRLAIDQCILSRRLAHHQATLQANQGAPEPACPAPLVYDPVHARCYRPSGVIDLPPVDITPAAEAGIGTLGAVLVGAAAGAGLWWWQRRNPKSKRKGRRA